MTGFCGGGDRDDDGFDYLRDENDRLSRQNVQVREDLETLTRERDSAREAVRELTRERDEARDWVRRMHRANVTTCVFCGEELPPNSDADSLVQHAVACPEHPMRELVEALRPFAKADSTSEVSAAWAKHREKARALVGKYGATASPSPPHPAANTTAEDDG